jgi:2-polyprenyl-6-methoxyphenol hydroxylase-like FAD-dependent oxidoreductase
MIPQAAFLEFIVGEARKHECFDLQLWARVSDLIIENNAVRGVRYRSEGGERELRASLTVAADGRASRVRALAGFVPKQNAASMDVMWLVLPRRVDEHKIDMTGFWVGLGRLVVVLARADEWQIGYVTNRILLRLLRYRVRFRCAGCDHTWGATVCAKSVLFAQCLSTFDTKHHRPHANRGPSARVCPTTTAALSPIIVSLP